MSRDPRPVAAFITLGCKANRYDTAALMGLTPADQLRVMDQANPDPAAPADVYVINTCAVTGQSAFQSRQMVRRARRANPAATVIATGCLASLEPEALLAAGADHVLGAGDDERARVARLLGGEAAPGPVFHHPAGGCQSRGRAVVKVQDGCDRGCAYCAVWRARGRPRSLPAAAVLGQLRALAEQGFRETVLTGIHLGLYGLDCGSSLPALLREIAAAGLPLRLRLSSLEPTELTGELLDLIAGRSMICPHVHVPLQSGDAGILAAMGRPYTPAEAEDALARARAALPDAAIGLDLIAGFPGETDATHANTRSLLERSPATYFHVFPFSARPGTAAATLPGQVPPTTARAWARELRALGTERKLAFLEAQRGRVLTVLAETWSEGRLTGTSGNYARVSFAGPIEYVGKLVTVIVEAVSGGGVAGRLVLK
jgi:threonylcarbamoyladenosine tRNA methylthiotransferase MtaB